MIIGQKRTRQESSQSIFSNQISQPNTNYGQCLTNTNSLHDIYQMTANQHQREIFQMQDKKDDGNELCSELLNQIDEWKGKADSDDYEDMMHEQSEEGTAPDNDSNEDQNEFLNSNSAALIQDD